MQCSAVVRRLKYRGLQVLELETFPGIEDKMCTLWDISVEVLAN